jgi:hypothetical protein
MEINMLENEQVVLAAPEQIEKADEMREKQEKMVNDLKAMLKTLESGTLGYVSPEKIQALRDLAFGLFQH